MKKLKTMTWTVLMAVMVLGAGICQAQSQDFTLENETGKVITAVYFRAYDSNWSLNFLGSGVLFHGYEKPIYFFQHRQTACHLFIKVRFLDGSEQTSAATENLCATDRITVFDGLFMRN
jgi:hypothetical protein